MVVHAVNTVVHVVNTVIHAVNTAVRAINTDVFGLFYRLLKVIKGYKRLIQANPQCSVKVYH